MKRLLVILCLVVLLCPFAVYARSGCCSHHGGVCGCGCCDGTGLSATCAPYYPECSGGSRYVPQYTPPPTSINNSDNSRSAYYNTNKDTAAPKTEKNSSGSGGWIIGIGLGGLVCYWLAKRVK